MPVSDLDIWRAAQGLLKAYGERAVFEAAERADQAIAKGDVQAEFTWMRVVRAVRELERQSPGPGEGKH